MMKNLIAAIDQQASTLPPESPREVLDFIGYLHARNERNSDPASLERVWGGAADFPVRPPQLPLSDM